MRAAEIEFNPSGDGGGASPGFFAGAVRGPEVPKILTRSAREFSSPPEKCESPLVEVGPKGQLFSIARHPYTQALLSAVPMISTRQERARRILLSGEIPTAVDIPARCRFATRCFRSIEECWRRVPHLEDVEVGHEVACSNPAPISDAIAEGAATEAQRG